MFDKIKKIPKYLKSILKIIFFPYLIRRKIIYLNALNNPKKTIDKLYFKIFGKQINYDSPRDLNEKIHWLQFYSDTSMWSIWADKYRVREYVKAKINDEKILNELYAVWHDLKDIDISYLPDSFVLKMNNGCGDILIVKDKAKITNEEVCKYFKNLFNKKFGVYNGEYHYWDIKPCIIVEQLLPDNQITDYKFYCSNGKVKFILVCINRCRTDVNFDTYDIQWNHYDVHVLSKSKKCKPGNANVKIPFSLNKMVEVCQILSKGIPFVRIDLFEIDKTPMFGEMTLTPAGGFITYYAQEFLDKLGDFVELPEKTINNYCKYKKIK